MFVRLHHSGVGEGKEWSKNSVQGHMSGTAEYCWSIFIVLYRKQIAGVGSGAGSAEGLMLATAFDKADCEADKSGSKTMRNDRIENIME